MNDYSEFRRSKVRLSYSTRETPLAGQPRSLLRRAAGYCLLGALTFAGAYLALSASITVLMAIAVLAVVVIVLLIAFGIWVMNNTPIL